MDPSRVGQKDQQQADAVDSEVVLDAERLDPRGLENVSHPARIDVLRPVEMGDQGNGDHEPQKGDDVGDPLDLGLMLLPLGPEQNDQHAQ